MLNGHEKKSTLLLVAKFSMWHSQFPSCKSLYMVNFVTVSEVATFPTFPKVKPFFFKAQRLRCITCRPFCACGKVYPSLSDLSHLELLKRGQRPSQQMCL